MWKPIKGYEGLYEVSSEGRVKSMSRTVNAPRGRTLELPERMMSLTKEKEGYLVVGLRINGKLSQKRVHRLVAEAFIDNPLNKTQVNHINEVKNDNRLENLEWVTPKENTNHGTCIERRANKLSIAVVGICKETSEEIVFTSSMEAQRNGFSATSITACCKGRRKSHKGYIWKYLSKHKKALEK